MASSSASSAAGEHWTAHYRRRLGIGSSPVVFYRTDPPKHGELKIIFIVLANNFVKVGANVRTIAAVALDSSFNLFGLTFGILKFETELGMQLYALRAAGNLARALKQKGIHDGPVVYHSALREVTACLDERCEGEAEAAMRHLTPRDLEEVDKKCLIFVGRDPDALLSWIDSQGVPELKGLIETMKNDGGNSSGVGSSQIYTRREHWTAKYRQHLGIGNSSVVGYNRDPPNQGEFKIIFVALREDVKDWDSTPPWTIGAMALNSSMKPFGITGGSIKFTNLMGMQLYALRAAGNLVKKLKEKGIHDGLVVYQSGDPEVTAFLNNNQEEPEAVMPDDLESVDIKFLNIVGTNPKKLFNWLDRLGTPALKALIEGMKKGAGVR